MTEMERIPITFIEVLIMRAKHIKIMLIVALAISFQASAIFAQRVEPGIDPPPIERVGQSGFQFLHLPTNARNAALANIVGLNNNDASAAFSNPANLVDIPNFDVAFSRLDYVADITYTTAAIAKNFGGWGVFGLHLASLDAGTMYRTENIESPDIDVTLRSGDLGTFEAGDFLVGLSYARRITDKLSIGGNIGRLYETLDSTDVENWNVDFGLFFETGFRSLKLSMVARNFGPDAEFTGFTELYGIPQSVRMPLDFRLGVSYDIIENTDGNPHLLTAYLEGSHPNDSRERVHAALEYTMMGMFSVRGGYKFNYDEQGLTLGGGVNFVMGNIGGRIDYAYIDYGLLSTVHLFTVGFRFGT
jgi:hypothetical protein